MNYLPSFQICSWVQLGKNTKMAANLMNHALNCYTKMIWIKQTIMPSIMIALKSTVYSDPNKMLDEDLYCWTGCNSMACEIKHWQPEGLNWSFIINQERSLRICIYPTPLLQEGCDTWWIFNWSIAVAFRVFPLLDWLLY